ncbi:VIT domain-containing protein [Psychroserpens sp. SPM9]|uniref:VIT domain-containing protein n=1 Tax=Psychroserpens sp. SPM9 TaxID=2975598 RepID=UPI0021A70D4F|nr:VIT domain-containing protein [Psychroserpens sp. SPM9]MDG5491855.1 VIT domain-containing protein [Psychroserpens sp. SPM9]
MKHILLFITLVCTASIAYTQTMPEVKVGEDHLRLSTLDIKSTVIGNRATTTYDMLFYNPQNRILEGELAFPLGQGQSVTHFAMDVNGTLRDAVIVEKEQGRVAFENTTRQTIDPGLLEKTKGNNYKARVYPIPANGSKRIVITFEQKLLASEGYHVMEIPLSYKKKLDQFSIAIEQFSGKSKPSIEQTHYKGLTFKAHDGKLQADFKKSKFAPSQTIRVKFPKITSQAVTVYRDYFNVYKTLDVKPRPKTKPKTITVFWDASYSMKYRKLNKEIQLLDTYFKYLKNVDVKLVVFSNSIKKHTDFKVKNGDWSHLKHTITNTVYDGGTSYLNLGAYISEDNLLFSDGMDNLGAMNSSEKPITAINAVNASNHEKLINMANDSGSQYINLNVQPVDRAFEFLINESYKFLGYKTNKNVSEVFPKKFASIQGDFSLSGRFSKATTLELYFGYNENEKKLVSITIDTKENNALVKRLWAKEKLNFLSKNEKENKTEIIDLAKRYHLITAYTSMIVLDRIEDYVRYKIEPPKELMADYKAQLQMVNDDEEDRLEDLNDRKSELFETYQDLMSWYDKDFSKPVEEDKKPSTPETNATSQQVASQETNGSSTQGNSVIHGENSTITTVNASSNLNGEERTISGMITSADDGIELPGANVMIKGTTRGVQSDFDGKFSIQAKQGEVIVVTYVGFKTIEQEVNENTTQINVALSGDAQLDEVVVMAYATVHKKSYTSASVIVSEEIIEDRSNQDFVKVLSGRAPGLNIATGSGQPGANSTIIIRGVTSHNQNNEALYIVDGAPMDEGTYKSLNQDDIASIDILNKDGATAIYGHRAANGVVVITTKEGLKTKEEDINLLNEKIDNQFKIKPWTPDAEYIEVLAKTKTIAEAFTTYLDLRNTYHNVPAFFLDVADFFESKNESEIAIQILTNLIEIDIDNHELMRALAYKLEAMQNYESAVYVYEAVLELRPEHPQSYRDLALAYEATKHYQKAFDLLYKIVDGALLEKDEDERFLGIEQIAYVEACHLLKLHEKELQITEQQRELFNDLEIDVRVVIDWNQDNTDIDLWVVNPKNEKVYFGNKKSNTGGRLSEDLTEGYGPEEFLLKEAIAGNYEVIVDYFGSETQKISGPTTLKITMFTNYGTKDETKNIQIMRLSEDEDEYEVGTVRF